MADHVFGGYGSFDIDDGLVCSAVSEIGGAAACTVRCCLGGAAIFRRDIFVLCAQDRNVRGQKKNVDLIDSINRDRVLAVKYFSIDLGDRIYGHIVFCQRHMLSGIERLYKSNDHVGYKGDGAVCDESGSKVMFFGIRSDDRLGSRSVLIKHGI